MTSLVPRKDVLHLQNVKGAADELAVSFTCCFVIGEYPMTDFYFGVDVSGI